ncbi:DUF1573 domain-containing protein [Geotalea sp. SG265]|uniref:DUF1573 domain-containing protein n=1 Tax=Geotalea sp. SG265 TaxID=2922867 RepID=UPI001FAFAC15|nr:DUF1573 domain-containing protein [Geotalea sp. SG265]
MKKRSSLLAVVFALSTITAAHAASQVTVPEGNFNFGTIVQGEKLHHTFSIKNTGDSPLSILRVVPSCGCTAANASSPVIQPGRSGEIKIVFDSTNFSGKVTKSIALETNDPKTPSYTLTLNGNIIEEIQITPRQVSLGQIKVGSSARSMVTLINRGNRPLSILSAKAQIPQITAEVSKKQLRTGEAATIEITATPRATDRILSGYLTITTDSPRKSEIIIPVYGSPIR